jgi:arylsulfatase
MGQIFLFVPAPDYVGKFLMTFKDYRQKAAGFNLDEVLRKLKESPGK